MRARGRVLVAMSGGVDSSVAAALLKEAGYDVTGATLNVWPEGAPPPAGESACCSLQAVHDARRVADRLGLPHYTLNMREAFQAQVIDYFVADYLSGKTPNPCIACNREIKFGVMLAKALALGFDFVATGHYARACFDASRGRHVLAKARDDTKDQSYALYGLTQPQLAHTLFPLGDYAKSEVRQIAARLGLPTAQKPESQEICFVTQGSYRDFLAAKAPASVRPGPIVDRRGNVLGRHQGLAGYTVGQRRGLGIAAGAPLFVLALDVERNALVVGGADDLLQQRLLARDCNYILWDEPPPESRVAAKIRYRAPAAAASLRPLPGGRAALEFASPQRAIAPGQAVVCYQGDLVAGGGVIEAAG